MLTRIRICRASIVKVGLLVEIILYIQRYNVTQNLFQSSSVLLH